MVTVASLLGVPFHIATKDVDDIIKFETNLARVVTVLVFSKRLYLK